ncbi:PP2C family protein-serine/threonine phosphatase [Antarctobacter jejuensis]|uniref:PP2C family protein-serine/threonine phosphatase n=1 Tax=Antarctobacter jejuensis TaxID=1439938 RepID=UPI003FD0A13D
MADLTADAATAQNIGRRARQEDAVIAHMPQGGPGLAVLSDGMGGHDDGDLASRILVSEMFGELFMAAARSTPGQAPFRAALDSANARLRQHIGAGCISPDTGGTLVSVAVDGDHLSWLSVGDSPLYLCRDGALTRLNENHSMAEQLDLMVQNGAMDADKAERHPHRHCLTSAVTGRQIPRVDCPADPLRLLPGDTLLLASDGLDVLPDTEILNLIARHAGSDSAALARALMAAVADKDRPEQDNVSIVVIRLAAPVSQPVRLPARLRKSLSRLLPRLHPVAEGRRAVRDALGGLRL